MLAKRFKSGPSYEAVPLSAYAWFQTQEGELWEVNLYEMRDLCVHLAHVADHEQPLVVDMTDGTQRNVWRAGMRRAMLLSLIASVRHQSLHLVEGVTFEEAAAEFQRQGLWLVERGRSSERRKQNSFTSIMPPVKTIGNDVHVLAREVIRDTCEHIANSIATWPRLISICEAALTGQLIEPISCSATEVYVQFASKPLPYSSSLAAHAHGTVRSGRAQELETLARLWPGWLQRTLTAFAQVATLAESTQQPATASSAGAGSSSTAHTSTNNVLQSEVFVEMAMQFIRSSQNGPFWATQFDVSSSDNHNMSRASVQRTERAVSEMKCALAASAVSEERDLWARVCLKLLCDEQASAPSPAVIFGGQLGDDGGNDAARQTLVGALAQRNIRVVKWVNSLPSGVRPAVFPPNWEPDNSAQNSAGTCAVKLSWMTPPASEKDKGVEVAKMIEQAGSETGVLSSMVSPTLMPTRAPQEVANFL